MEGIKAYLPRKLELYFFSLNASSKAYPIPPPIKVLAKRAIALIIFFSPFYSFEFKLATEGHSFDKIGIGEAGHSLRERSEELTVGAEFDF